LQILGSYDNEKVKFSLILFALSTPTTKKQLEPLKIGSLIDNTPQLLGILQ